MALPDLRTESFVTAVAGAMLALAASADAVDGAVREILGSAMTHCTMRCARTCSACYAVILAVSTSRALCNKLLQLLLRREHVPALPVIFTVNDNSLPDTDQIRHGLRAFCDSAVRWPAARVCTRGVYCGGIVARFRSSQRDELCRTMFHDSSVAEVFISGGVLARGALFLHAH